MAPQAQKIAFAESLGWKKDVPCVNEHEEPVLGWRKPGDNSGTGWGDGYLPDISSLDTLIPAAAACPGDEPMKIRRFLEAKLGVNHCFATPDLWLEGYLLVKGLWK